MQEAVVKEFNNVNKSIQTRLSPELKEEIARNSSFNIV